MPEYDFAQAETRPRSEGALSELQNEIERLRQSIAVLDERLAPIMRSDENEKLSVPQPIPSSDLRKLISLLADGRYAVERITDRIDL